MFNKYTLHTICATFFFEQILFKQIIINLVEINRLIIGFTCENNLALHAAFFVVAVGAFAHSSAQWVCIVLRV